MLMIFLTFLSHFMPLNRKPCESYYENYQQRLNSLPSYTKTWRAEFIPSWPNLTEIENFSSSINSFSNSAVQSRNPSQPMQGFGIIL